MILIVDRKAVEMARQVNSVRETDIRYYYLIDVPGQPSALIVCRNGYSLPDMVNQSVDCLVGWDTAMAGFAPEHEVGMKRTKITIFRPTRIDTTRTITWQLARSA